MPLTQTSPVISGARWSRAQRGDGPRHKPAERRRRGDPLVRRGEEGAAQARWPPRWSGQPEPRCSERARRPLPLQPRAPRAFARPLPRGSAVAGPTRPRPRPRHPAAVTWLPAPVTEGPARGRAAGARPRSAHCRGAGPCLEGGRRSPAQRPCGGWAAARGRRAAGGAGTRGCRTGLLRARVAASQRLPALFKQPPPPAATPHGLTASLRGAVQ